MIESLFEIDDIFLSGNNILKVMKSCDKYKLKYFNRIDYINIEKEESEIEQKNILTNDDINVFRKAYKEKRNQENIQIINGNIYYLIKR